MGQSLAHLFVPADTLFDGIEDRSFASEDLATQILLIVDFIKDLLIEVPLAQGAIDDNWLLHRVLTDVELRLRVNIVIVLRLHLCSEVSKRERIAE